MAVSHLTDFLIFAHCCYCSIHRQNVWWEGVYLEAECFPSTSSLISVTCPSNLYFVVRWLVITWGVLSRWAFSRLRRNCHVITECTLVITWRSVIPPIDVTLALLMTMLGSFGVCRAQSSVRQLQTRYSHNCRLSVWLMDGAWWWFLFRCC